jgi:chorismate synthase
MGSYFGRNVRVQVFGQSHAAAVGCVIDGLPAGFAPDMEKISAFMARRAPGQNTGDTARKEPDQPEILSGLHEGKTCGAPLCAVIRNRDAHSADYAALRDVPRPGHADFSLRQKFGDAADLRGGGHASGRLTAPLVFAGALCAQILEDRNIAVASRILQIGAVAPQVFDDAETTPTPLFLREITNAQKAGDSVGGIVGTRVTGLPAGLGDPMFEGVENRLAQALFGIPAVRGIAFGAGFSAAAMRGSAHNDAFTCGADGRVTTETNHHGGVLGGITTGMPLEFQLAFKPTPSIALAQKSVDLGTNCPTELRIKGRHDACVVPRAVPVVEAVTACVILDLLLVSSE